MEPNKALMGEESTEVWGQTGFLDEGLPFLIYQFIIVGNVNSTILGNKV